MPIYGPKVIPVVMNWQHPISRGLIFNAPMVERGGGRVKDLVGSRNSTIFFDAAAKIPTFVPSPLGNALNLDGSDWAVPSPVLSFSTLGTQFTIAQWVKMSSYATAQVYNTFDNAIMISVAANDWRWQQDEAAFTNIGCTFPRVVDVWYLYTVTHAGPSAGQTKLYLNGAQFDNGAAVVNPTSGNLTIGRQPGASPRSLIGQTVGPMIWKRVLNKQEIKQLHANPWIMYKDIRNDF